MDICSILRCTPVKIVAADYTDPGHAADILRLMEEYAGDPMGGGTSLPREVAENLVAGLAGFPTAFSLLAVVDEKAVGLVNCFRSLSTFNARELINIHDLIVTSAFRGRGVGRALMQAVEEIARQRGCCKLTLEVLEANAVAQQLYRQQGFDGYALNPTTGRALFWQKLLDY